MSNSKKGSFIKFDSEIESGSQTLMSGFFARISILEVGENSK